MITAVIMVGSGGGESEALAWVQDGRRAAAADLIEEIGQQPLVERVIVATPMPDNLPMGSGTVEHFQTEDGRVHFGRCLAEILETFRPEKVLYFGGGAAPLLGKETLAEVVRRLDETAEIVLTNNLHASDWAAVSPAEALIHWKERLPQDNMIGWVLSTEAGLPVEDWPATSESRLDIDTPADLLTLRLHAGTRRHLREYLASLPLDTGRLERILAVLATPASQVFLAGRIGPEAWQALNNVTRCWLRVVSEERGMISSGRLASGQVYSLLADHIEVVGMDYFFKRLSDVCQAGLIDSRVLLAHHRLWPPKSDRYASDLGLMDGIADPWLREFTAAAVASQSPVQLGGHGLLNGDLLAFCDLL